MEIYQVVFQFLDLMRTGCMRIIIIFTFTTIPRVTSLFSPVATEKDIIRKHNFFQSLNNKSESMLFPVPAYIDFMCACESHD